MSPDDGRKMYFGIIGTHHDLRALAPAVPLDPEWSSVVVALSPGDELLPGVDISQGKAGRCGCGQSRCEHRALAELAQHWWSAAQALEAREPGLALAEWTRALDGSAVAIAAILFIARSRTLCLTTGEGM